MNYVHQNYRNYLHQCYFKIHLDYFLYLLLQSKRLLL